MAETIYIVIDGIEKRIRACGHYGELGNFLAAVAASPVSVEGFDSAYQGVAGKPFYDRGNRPRIPSQLEVTTIRAVLGMEGRPDNEVIRYWREVSLYRDSDYVCVEPDCRTDFDIPDITQALIDEWKEFDSDGDEFPTVQDFRRFQCNDGIVVADLRTRVLTYITDGAFSIDSSSLPGWKVNSE